MSPSILHVGPHPDDEVLGAGATLRLLQRDGWTIHNLACSLGRPADRVRREAELRDAADRLNFETTTMTPPAPISAGDDLACAARAVTAAVSDLINQTSPAVVMSPHPHDRHHGHETVARGVREALRTMPNPPVWWMWGLWSDLPIPTLLCPFDESVMRDIQAGISAYKGENERNHYDRLYPARAQAYSVLGAERVLGFGAQNISDKPFADLLTEVHRRGDRWMLGTPRQLDPARPLLAGGTTDLTWWVEDDSLTTRLLF